MLELFVIALASLGIAVVAVWLYRKVTESRGVSTSLVSLSGHRGSLRLSAQQGFVNLQSTSASGRRGVGGQQVKLRNNSVRKPWGW